MLSDKLKLFNKTFKNRIIIPPMASQTANVFGDVSEKTLFHYKRLASSGAALVFVEYSYIHSSGKSESNQLGIYRDEQIIPLARLAKVIKAEGALAGIQLVHAGGKTTRDLTIGRLIGPSSIQVPVKGENLDVPDMATLEDINLIKNSFLDATSRAVAAGFDIIELHCAHGYGLNQWLSPITNKRKDRYGGVFKNRIRLLTEIIELIHFNHPLVLLSVRMPGQDYFPGGLTPTEGIRLGRALEYLGVNILNVSSGIGGWRRPRNFEGEGYLVDDARRIQNQVKIPVIGVGGLKSKEVINQMLFEKAFTFAAIGRAMLEDPSHGKTLNIT